MEKIADPDNLRLEYWKSRKAKDVKPEIIANQNNLDANLLCLRNELLNDSVEVGNYHYFTIYDPKERVILLPSVNEYFDTKLYDLKSGFWMIINIQELRYRITIKSRRN